MTAFQSILAVIFSENSSDQSKDLLAKFVYVAHWLEADLHVLVSQNEFEILQEELDRKVSAELKSHQVILHASTNHFVQEALRIVETQNLELMLLQHETGYLEHPSLSFADKQSLLSQSNIPLLLIPPDLIVKDHFIESFVVPVSGEKRLCDALTIAFQLAEKTKTPIDMIHVTPSESCLKTGESLSIETLGDQFHHEYYQLVEKIISEASPFATAEEKKWIRHFCQCCGEPIEEIQKYMNQHKKSLLVLEWKGVLKRGHAETLKALLWSVNYPVLVIKETEEVSSKLKVAEEFETVESH